MTKQPIRLIISDIDGTILDDQHQVDPQLREQIPLAEQRKHPLRVLSFSGMEPPCAMIAITH